MSLGGVQNTEGTNAGEIFVQFNQDATSLVAGSPSGYHLFALSADDGLEEIYASNTGQEVCLVDRLFSSSLVAIVTVSAPRKLIVCHYKKGTEICNYSYSNTILAVKLNRSRLVVCLEESLHIHNIRDMKVLHTIRDTPPNPRGLIALACGDRALLAYPGSARTGELQVFDTAALGARCVLAAHEAPLAALAWSRCSRRLATASERGTVIRVFLIPERVKLYELRRGLARHVSIAALAFSAAADLLAAASNTETVHIFKLDDADKQVVGGEQETAAGAAAGVASGGAPGGAAGEDGTWLGGWLAAAVAAGGRLLPAHVASVLQQGRAAATARLPTPRPARLAIALTSGAGGTRLLVATGGGALLVYGVDARDGGVCPLRAEHSLLPRRAAPRPHAGGSYAGKLRGAVDAEEERAEELTAAMEGSPPRSLPLRDPAHFPPIQPARKH